MIDKERFREQQISMLKRYRLWLTETVDEQIRLTDKAETLEEMVAIITQPPPSKHKFDKFMNEGLKGGTERDNAIPGQETKSDDN